MPPPPSRPFARQRKKVPRGFKGIGQSMVTELKRDEIEEVAMLARRGVGPFARGTAAMVGTREPHIEAAPQAAMDIADEPVAAFAAPPTQKMAADALGFARQCAGEVGCGRAHGTNRRLALAGDSAWSEIDDGDPANADLRLADAGTPPGCDPRYDSFINHIVLHKRAGADLATFEETRYAAGEKHVSDHCPVAVTLGR
jgi:hypothetical protein